MPALLLLAILTVDRPLTPELSAGVGVGTAGYAFAGGRLSDTLLMPYVFGRAVLGPVAGELEVFVALPLGSSGAVTSVTAIPRLGFGGSTWSALLGATLQLAPETVSPLLALPSLRLRKNFTDDFGLSFGVFDLHGQAPAHLSAELGPFDIGYVAPVGFTAGARLPLPRTSLALKLRVLAFRLYNSELALLTVGVGWGRE